MNLMPDSKDDRLKQYEYAWRALLDTSANENDRLHAKCWLTYRTLDGEIPADEWINQILPVEIPTQNVRWLSSIPLAEAYVWLLRLNDKATFRHRVAEAVTVLQNNLESHPGGALNFLRGVAMIAFDMMQTECGQKPLEFITQAIAQWQAMWATFRPEAYPFRFAEMRGDAAVLHCLLRMWQSLGGLSSAMFRLDATWADSLVLAEKTQPWWRCIEALRIQPFMPCVYHKTARPEPKTRTDIKTRNDLAQQLFHGFGVELGVAAGKFTEQILTVGHVAKLHGIDKWNDHHNVTEWFQAMERVKAFPTSCQLLRANFSEVVSQFEDGSLNFVYVDGYAHTGQEGGATLREWWPKVAVGGIMAGHDYSARWQKTMDAVDAFVVENGLQLHLTTDDDPSSWWVTKQRS